MKESTFDPVTEKEYSHENEYDYLIQQFCELKQCVKHEEEVIDFAFSLRDELINDLENKDDTIRLKYIKWIEDEYLLRTKDFLITQNLSIHERLIGFKSFKYKTKNIVDGAIEGEKEDWDGTLYTLAYKIHTDYENKVFPSANSCRDAYRIATNTYNDKNGKEITMGQLERAWDKNKDLYIKKE